MTNMFLPYLRRCECSIANEIGSNQGQTGKLLTWFVEPKVQRCTFSLIVSTRTDIHWADHYTRTEYCHQKGWQTLDMTLSRQTGVYSRVRLCDFSAPFHWHRWKTNTFNQPLTSERPPQVCRVWKNKELSGSTLSILYLLDPEKLE